MKLNKGNKMWAELEVVGPNQVKIVKAQKYIKTNQYQTYWGQINARDLAREINGKLVTR